MAGVELRNVTKRFGTVTALDGIDLSVGDGEILGLLGPSGCGKTTALRVIAGFESPDDGEIFVGDRLAAGSGRWMPPEHRHVGMVFQDYALFPHLTVADNVAFGLTPGKDARRRVSEVLDLVGLGEFGHRYPYELSGGQQQRLALARALAPRPASLLMDEPFSNLDATLRCQMRHEVRSILKHEGVTAVFVTHDQRDAFAICDRIAVMRDGRVEQIGTPQQLYSLPATEFVARFVGLSNVLPGRIADGDVDGRACVATEFGLLHCHPDCPGASGDVAVCVRPEWFQLDPDGPLSGTVRSVLYEGEMVELIISMVGMHGVREITMRVHASEAPVPGHEVRFRLAAPYVPVIAPQGDSVSVAAMS